MLGDADRGIVRRLLEEFDGQDAIPKDRVADLIRVPIPRKDPSGTGNYIVDLYDGFDDTWMIAHGPCSWDEAVEYWARETNNGLEKACYGDINYYTIHPETLFGKKA